MNNSKNTSETNPLDWNLASDGTLTLFGKGRLPDFDCGKNPPAPWMEEKDLIQKLIISEGITEIGIHSFKGCNLLTEVMLPPTLRKIHAGAFADCRNLLSIDTGALKLIYYMEADDMKKKEADKRHALSSDSNPPCIVFGAYSFANTPFARAAFGDFYIRDEKLYLCFSPEKDLFLPDEVRTLMPLSLADLTLSSLRLNKTEVIEDLAFCQTKIEKNLYLPTTILLLKEHALAGLCAPAVVIPKDCSIKKTSWAQYEGKVCGMGKNRESDTLPPYVIRTKDQAGYSPFYRLFPVKNHAVHHKDGSISELSEGSFIDVGRSMLMRLYHGSILSCISLKDNQVIAITSYYWDADEKTVEKYHMLPRIKNKAGSLGILDESYDYLDRKAFHAIFDMSDGEELEEKKQLRSLPPNVREEWFCCKDSLAIEGILELSLLELWNRQNPEIQIASPVFPE